MNTFIHDDFLLSSKAACRLYHEYAAGEPIFDYHCHLSPLDLANNRRFSNLSEIWLEGDHYKWRAMRLHGVDDRFCTGNASPREKFDAWAGTVPFTLRNPLYHWTHLELARYFGVHDLLDPQSADRIWNTANEALASDELSSWGILEKFKVRFIGTTDDPTDSLEHHATLRQSDCPATVAPSFRPDKGILIQNTSTWNTWVDQLEAATGSSINDVDALKSALENRMDFFAKAGCRASDHGLIRCPNRIASDSEAAITFGRVRSGGTPTIEAAEGFAGNLLAFLGASYARRGWVMQLHLGAIRNVNQAVFRTLGADVGCDSIGDENQITPLAGLLGELAARGQLPRTILYNLNPCRQLRLRHHVRQLL
jgi:glucuronate isomerase